jgi:hypothetical protein
MEQELMSRKAKASEDKRSLREWLRAHPWLSGGLGVVVIAASLGFAVKVIIRETAAPYQTHAWYYDLNTEQLFVAEVTKHIPIDAPSGPASNGAKAGVRAHVFSFGDCSDPDQRFIGWLETLDANGNRLIRSESDTRWVGFESRRGTQLVQSVLRAEQGGQLAHPCSTPQ